MHLFIILLALPLLAISMLFFAFVVMAIPLAPLWIQAKSAGVPVSLLNLLGMKLRRLDPLFLINQFITLRKAGVQVEIKRLEAHILAGGNLNALTEALVSAQKAGLNTTLEKIAAIDLAGRDVRDAVKTYVQPKVIICPKLKEKPITGVARDGIRLGARVRVTARSKLEALVGGANEETIRARIGEGIVTSIGQADSHQDILKDPERIAQFILSRGLDSGTAFEIVSVDTSDIDVLDNVAARLAAEQAEANKRTAQAKAERDGRMLSP